MELNLTSKHELLGDGYFLGLDEENRSEQIIININPAELLDKWAYIEFHTDTDDKYTTERLDIIDNQVIYDIPNGLLKQGRVGVQVVFRDGNGFIWKSFTRKFVVSNSINACDNLPNEYPDFISEAQKLLDEIEIQADKVDDVLLNEETRIQAEAIRVENENTRISNEDNRIAAETLRSSAETERISNEETRQSNELARVTAETERKTKFNTWENTLGVLDNLSNALKNTASGEVIRVDDVSPVDHNAKVKVRSKNLLNADGMVNSVFVKNEDGSFTFTKNGSDRYSNLVDISIPANTSVTFSAKSIEGTADGFAFQIQKKDATYISAVSLSSTKLKDTRILSDEPIKIRMYLGGGEEDGAYLKVSGLQIELGDTATEYTPYVDPTSVTVTRCGLNILSYPYNETTKTRAGITYTDNGDGSITAQGVATADSFFGLSTKLNLGNRSIKPETLDAGYRIGEKMYYNPNNGVLSLNIANGETVDQTFYPMVVVGSILPEYEEYKGITYTPNADGTLTIASTAPTMTLLTDKDVNMDLEYNQDINVVIKSLQDKINALTK